MKKFILVALCALVPLHAQHANIMGHLQAIGMTPPADAPIHYPSIKKPFTDVTRMLTRVDDNGKALADFLVAHRPLIIGGSNRGYAKRVARYQHSLVNSSLNNKQRAQVHIFGSDAVAAMNSWKKSGMKTWKKWAIGAGSTVGTLALLALLARWRMRQVAQVEKVRNAEQQARIAQEVAGAKTTLIEHLGVRYKEARTALREHNSGHELVAQDFDSAWITQGAHEQTGGFFVDVLPVVTNIKQLEAALAEGGSEETRLVAHNGDAPSWTDVCRRINAVMPDAHTAQQYVGVADRVVSHPLLVGAFPPISVLRLPLRVVHDILEVARRANGLRGVMDDQQRTDERRLVAVELATASGSFGQLFWIPFEYLLGWSQGSGSQVPALTDAPVGSRVEELPEGADTGGLGCTSDPRGEEPGDDSTTASDSPPPGDRTSDLWEID